MGIDDLRKEIDKLDETILHNLASRKNIIKEIAKLKKLMKIPVPDAEREKTVLKKLKNNARENGIDAEMIHSIYSLIFENSRLEQEIENNAKKCTIKEIGMVGFGRIGKLAAKHLSKNFNVYVSNKSGKIETKGKKVIFSTLEEACGKDLVIIAVPISEFERVLKKIAPLLKNGALVADVCSVKEYAIDLMEKILPKNIQILGTHPLFGPDSATDSLLERKVVLCRARVNDELYNQTKSFLKSMGLIVIEASPKEHDMQIAKSLVLTHLIGRVLIDMKAKNLDIDTRGYTDLIKILDTVKNDSMQFFEDINKYNKYAAEARKSFTHSLNMVGMLLK